MLSLCIISNMQHSCLCISTTAIIGMCHHVHFLLLKISSTFVLGRHVYKDQKTEKSPSILITHVSMNLHTVFMYSVKRSQFEQQIKIQSNMFLTFGTTTYFLRLCRSIEFECVLLVLLHEHLLDINVFLEGLHLGSVIDVTTKTQTCLIVQQK